MRILKKSIVLVFFLFILSCSAGGPLTPVDSFKAIKHAVEVKDPEKIVSCLSKASLGKIEKLKSLIKDMSNDQLLILSQNYGYTQDKLRNLKPVDAASLYFFSDHTGVNLRRYFLEKVISVDIYGDRAIIKVDSGVELDFVREGPYWKFDISEL
jgi:hypothetical protein